MIRQRLRRILSKLCKRAPDETSEPVSKHPQAEQDGRETVPGLRADPQIPATVKDDKSPAEHRREIRELVSVVIDGATLLLVVVGAIFTGCLLREAARQNAITTAAVEQSKRSADAAIDANKATRDNFRQDQRPYLWLASEQDRPFLLVLPAREDRRGQIVWTWRYTNYGRSPAYNVRSFHALEFGDKVLSRKLSLGDLHPSPPVAPNQINFKTAASRCCLGRAEFDQLAGTEESVMLYGRITYTDAYRTEYETGFCLYRLTSGEIAHCPMPSSNYLR